MSDIGTMVSELISAGCSPEVAAKVVTEAVLFGVVSGGSRVDAATEKRRAWDREYRRNKRTIPPDSTRFHPTSENASLSKEERIEDKKESKRETTRGSRLPVGWTPTPQDWVVACELLSEPRANSELEKFTDHWKQQPGSKGVKLDWEAAWRNWVRRAAEYSKPRNSSDRPLTQHQIERENSRKILDDLDNFANGGSQSQADPRILRLNSGDGPASVHGGIRGDVVAVSATRSGKGS